MKRRHELKTWPAYFEAVERGEKLFEVRFNDRFFQAGDVVDLVKFDPAKRAFVTDKGHSFRSANALRLSFTIGPILQGGQFGIEPGYCVFSLLEEQSS